MNLNIAICDDEVCYRKLVMRLIEKYNTERNCNLSVTPYEHDSKLLEDAKKNGFFDAYILDVVMPGMNGIELGHTLREMGFNGKILYLTSSEEYAIDAFKVKAYNYILKPIEPENFFLALDDAFHIDTTQDSTDIVIKSTKGNIKVNSEHILYAALDKRAISYYLTDGQIIHGRSIRVSFSEATQDLLQESSFTVCGASMVINLQYIQVIEDNSVTFQNGEKIFVPQRAVKKLLSDWKSFLAN